MILFFAALIALAVALAISRIAVDVRKIREHSDRVDKLVADTTVGAQWELPGACSA